MIGHSMDEVLMMAKLHDAGHLEPRMEPRMEPLAYQGERVGGTARCPWDDWTRPNVEWCEERKCQIVGTPANTWSNIAYVLAGIYMIRRAGRHSSDLKLFGPAAVATGIFSGLYHASFTKLFQWFDFIGMYMFCMLPVVINLRRLRYLRRDQQVTVYVAAVLCCGVLTSLLQSFSFPIQLIVVGLVVVATATEYSAKRKSKESNQIIRYSYFIAASGLLAAGLTCSMLDVTGVWCNPHNHLIQGHAVWHLFTAAALVCQFRHYELLEEDTAFDDQRPAPEQHSPPAYAVPTAGSQRNRWGKTHKRATSVDIESLLFQPIESDELRVRNRSCDDLKKLASISMCAPLVAT